MLFKNKQNYFTIKKNNKTLKPFMLNSTPNCLNINTVMCSVMYSVMSFFTMPAVLKPKKHLPSSFKNYPVLSAGSLITLEDVLFFWVVLSIFIFVMFYTYLYRDWQDSSKYRQEVETNYLKIKENYPTETFPLFKDAHFEYLPRFKHNPLFRLLTGCFLFNGFIFYINYSFMMENSFTPLMLAVSKDECLVIVVFRFVLGIMFLFSLIIILGVLIYVFSNNQKKLRSDFMHDLFNFLDYWLYYVDTTDFTSDFFHNYMCNVTFSFRFVFIFCYLIYIVGSVNLFANFLVDFFTYIHPAHNTLYTNYSIPIKFRLIGTFLHFQFLFYVLWPNASTIVINRRVLKRNESENSLLYNVRLVAGLTYLLFSFYIFIYVDEWKNPVDLKLTYFFHVFMFVCSYFFLYLHGKQTLSEVFSIQYSLEYGYEYGRLSLDPVEYEHINTLWQFYNGFGPCLWFIYLCMLALVEVIVTVLFNFKIFTQVTINILSLHYLLTLYKSLFWLFVSLDEVLFMNSLTTQLFMWLLVLYIIIPPLLFFYLCYLMFKVSKTLE